MPSHYGRPVDHGVPVLSCEQDNFAAFYTRDSGFRADFRLDDPAQQAGARLGEALIPSSFTNPGRS